ncbi:hypothetical protein H0H87_004175 [Tephrocybe sp. NHM501043]|nr:hypothetical protein H0H87_004175 [Tephrocybe sp. NHM501043]
MAAEKVSFTIRRPTPLSRAPSSGPDSDAPSYKVPSLPRHLVDSRGSTPGSPLARSSTSSPSSYAPHDPDSSDDDDDEKDELVTGFDRFGVRRCVDSTLLSSQSNQLTAVVYLDMFHRVGKDRPTKAAPLVIPALKNRDWRDLARKRRSAAQYVPPSAKAETGADGSVGGLGTRDTINSGPVLSGLQYKKDSSPTQVKQEGEQPNGIQQEDVKMEVEEDDEDKAALRAILNGTTGAAHDGPIIDIIPTPALSEADAYKQDVEELPEAATLEDYARVPVSQFGAALLRGMGWKEGTAATRKPGKGLVEPYLPESRPALLGIGAKEQEVYDDGSKKKGGANKRPEKRYVPLVKKEREDRSSSAPRERDHDRARARSRSPHSRSGGSTAVSRKSSRSRERGSTWDDRRGDTSDRRERDYKRDSRDRDRDRNYRRDDRDRDRDYRRNDGDRDRDYRRDDGDRERKRERSRDSSRKQRV